MGKLEPLYTVGGNVNCVLSPFTRVWLFVTLWTSRLLCPWNSPGKNTGVGCYAFLQGIFPTQWLNPTLLCLLHCRWVLYHKHYLGSPCKVMQPLWTIVLRFKDAVCWTHSFNIFTEIFPHIRKIVCFLRKLKIELSYDPAILLLCIY